MIPWWLKWIVLAIAVLAIAGWVESKKLAYDNALLVRGRAEGAAKVQAAWDDDKQARIRAFSAKQREYVEASLEAERLKKERDDELWKKQQDAKRRLASIPEPVASIRIPLIAGVLNDDRPANDRPGAAAAAREPERNPAAGAAAAVDTTVGLWAEWSETMKGLYEACRSQVIGLVANYDNLREKSKHPALDALNLP